MIGLILKDLIQMKRIIKTLAGLALLYVLIAFFQGSSEIVVSLSVMVCVITGINSLGTDEQSKWNQYALTLPFDRASLVIAKYIMLLIMSCISAVAVMLLELCISRMAGGISTLLVVGGVSFIGSLLSMSLMLPLIYKFGIEGGRYVLMAVVMIPFIIAILGERAGVKLSAQALSNATQFFDRNPWILVIIAFACVIVSMLLSVAICKKKEY